MNIGTLNRLSVVRDSPHGMYLSDGTSDVLLPRKYVPDGTGIGDELEVFLFTDSEDRPIATTQQPRGMVGDIVPLVVKQVGRGGAFLDWGLEKDLLVPYGEQHRRMQPGGTYLVLIRLDQGTGRVYGSTRLAEHLDGDPTDLAIGQEVSIVVADVSRDAVRAVVDRRYFGTIFADEIFGSLSVGDERKAYIKQVRDDGRIALSLSPQGKRGVDAFEDVLLRRLRDAGGELPYGDGSSPEAIREAFGVSKGTFKKALGGLFRSGLVDLGDLATRLRR